MTPAQAHRTVRSCDGPEPLRLACETHLERHATQLFEEFREHERPETFRSLFESAGPVLLPLVRMKVRRQRSHLDPAELLTDTFAQVYRYRHTFADRGPGSFVRWFLTIADNLMRQEARETSRRTRREQLVARNVEDKESDPFVLLLADEARLVARLTYGQLRALVLEGMRQLPPKQEQTLLLHAQERLNYDQIAARLGTTRGAVCMRMQRARLTILDHLRRRLSGQAPAADVPPTAKESAA